MLTRCQNIAKLLKAAGEAVQALTKQSGESEEPESSIENRKEAFKTAAAEYFKILSTVDVNLRRQIYALEEANIIPTGPLRDAGGTDATTAKDRVIQGPGAMGNLDVGWLNSRSDKVGKDMEAELWAQTRELIDDLDIKDIFNGLKTTGK
jgi:hypothetical protein